MVIASSRRIGAAHGRVRQILVAGLAAAVLAGCAHTARRGTAAVAVAPAVAASQPLTATESPPSLAMIVNDQLQHGHYAEGGRALKRYLAAHPDDHAARSMLRQLEADPAQWLGREVQAYVTRPGDSYSALAQRSLGDASLFLILARYNHASDPSTLLAGQTIRLPRRATALTDAEPHPAADAAASTPAAADDTPTASSVQLQKDAIARLGAGAWDDALRQVDRALAGDPGLATMPGDSPALRRQLVAACHQRAIVLYRDQQLDPAIALLDRVLRIQPGYEPATAYRARALELKRRLRQY